MTFGFPFSTPAALGLVPFGRVLDRGLERVPRCEDVLVPVRIPDLLFAAEHPERFPRAFCPTADTTRLLDSHPAFFRFLETHDLAQFAPETYEGEPRFPCVLKEGRSLWCGYGVHLIQQPDVLKRVRLQLAKAGVSCVLQEWIPGQDEYVLHTLCSRGTLLHAAARRIRLEPGLSKKKAPQSGVPVEVDLEPFQRLFAALEYTGFACANFKVRPDGRVALFEVNPRLGASLTFPANASVLGEQVRLAEDTFR